MSNILETTGFSDWEKKRNANFKPKDKPVKVDGFNRRVQEYFYIEQEASGQPLNPSAFVSLINSNRVVTGNQAEFIILEAGKKAIANRNTTIFPSGFAGNTTPEEVTIVDICHGKSFTQAIFMVRQHHRNGDEISELISKTAIDFYVPEKYVSSLVKFVGKDKEVPIHYPDHAIVYESNNSGNLFIVANESKLSGNNDSKSVSENISELVDVMSYFSQDGCKIGGTITLLTIRNWLKRWENAYESNIQVLAVGEIWNFLFGFSMTAEEEETVLEALAKQRGHELFLEYLAQCAL